MTQPDPLVRRYLRRLGRALAGLPAGQRRDIVEDVAEHVRTSRAELPGGGTEQDVRAILGRLGDPDTIAARAWEEAGADPAAPAPWGVREVAAILLLTAGAVVLPVVGPLAGLVLVAGSPRWTGRQKLAALAVPVGVLLLVSLATVLVRSYWPAEVTFTAVVLVPLGAGIMLAVPRATRPFPAASRPVAAAVALLLTVLAALAGPTPAGFWATPLLVLVAALGAARLGAGEPPREEVHAR